MPDGDGAGSPLPPTSDHLAALIVATLVAPCVLLAPVFILFVMQDEGSRVGTVLGLYAVAVAVAGTLLAAAGRRGRARSLEVGFIWILAGAAAATVFAQPSGSDIGGGVAQAIVEGAFGGALTSAVFAGILRLLRTTIPSALLLAITAPLCLVACAESEPPAKSDAVASATARAQDSVPTLIGDSVWYHRIRLLDVTGDGRPDSLDLQARGRSSDSSVFTFRVFVDGKVAFTDAWSSDYELVDPPPEAATPAGRDSVLRASLDSTLGQIRVRTIDPADWSAPWPGDGDDCMGDPRDCLALEFRERRAQIDWTRVHRDSIAVVYERVRRAAFDTAAVLRIASEMRRPGAVQFTLGYGYETTLNLAWSPSEREVFVIFSCC